MSKTSFQTAPIILWLGLLFFVVACRPPPLACEDPLGCVVIRPGSPLRVATLLPVTGETAVWGQELSRAINLAIANQGGELLNHDIELVPLDTACDPTAGQEAMQTIDGDRTLLGIIGPACSDVAAALLPTVRNNSWLMISPASSAPTLTENQAGLAFFRTIPNHLYQAEAAAYFAFEQLGARQAAVFQDETNFNSQLAQAFSNTFTRLGGTVSYQGHLSIGQIELEQPLTETAVNPPELIYLALFEPEASLLVNRLEDSRALNQAILLGSDTLLTTSFAVGTAQVAKGIYLTGPIFSGDAYDSFLASWTARYEAPPADPTLLYAYDATRLLLTAIEEVAIAGQTGALVIGREAMREKLGAGEEIIGLSGVLRCSPAGECAASSYGIYELDPAEDSGDAWPPPLVWQFENDPEP